MNTHACPLCGAAGGLAPVDEIPQLRCQLEPLSVLSELATQVIAEQQRQRGWLKRCAGSGAPEKECPEGGELIYGPAEAA